MSKRNILREGNVAIMPSSMTIYERHPMMTNPRDNVSDSLTVSNPYLEQPLRQNFLLLGDYKIVPDGSDNLFPYRWKNLVENDSIMPGMLRQKADLLLAGGDMIFVEKIVDGKKKIEEVQDNQISDWLDSWGFADWLIEQSVDFISIERCASLMIPNKFRRLQGYDSYRKIAKIQRIPVQDVRMELMENFRINNHYISNWQDWHSEVIKVPTYDGTNPFAFEQSMFYSKMPSFCSDYYGRPSTIGVANYLSLKLLLLNNSSDLTINAPFRYHIESPMEYWEEVRQKNHWDNNQLQDYENEFLLSIDDFLRAEDGRNALKRFHTKFMLSEMGKERLGWSIKKIDDDSDKRMESNFKAFEKINENIIASANLDPALSNIQISGSLSSGLDKLIAFNIHQLINTPIPRAKILQPVNEAIKVNFWRPDYRPKIGIRSLQLDYQDKIVSKEQNKPTTDDPQNN